MLLSNLLVFLLSVALTPSLVSAAIFPKDSLVKSIDGIKAFNKVMRQNQTSVVAFVAPWCGHCQKLAPEYDKAAKTLDPLVPLYAVDCDAEHNKPLCAKYEVKGFPTVKLFPRGNQAPPSDYQGERVANALASFVSKSVPHGIKRLKTVNDITSWTAKVTDKPRVILMNKKEKAPLIWQVLSNKFKHRMNFGNHFDSEGKSSEALGFETGEFNQNKILVYPVGSSKPVLYDGSMKTDALSDFFRGVIKGTIDLNPKEEETRVEAADPEVPQEPETKEQVVLEKAVPVPEPEQTPEEPVAQAEETKDHIVDEL